MVLIFLHVRQTGRNQFLLYLGCGSWRQDTFVDQPGRWKVVRGKRQMVDCFSGSKLPIPNFGSPTTQMMLKTQRSLIVGGSSGSRSRSLCVFFSEVLPPVAPTEFAQLPPGGGLREHRPARAGAWSLVTVSDGLVVIGEPGPNFLALKLQGGD